jgi:hypothetical protein
VSVDPGDSFDGIPFREWMAKESDASLLRGVPAGRLAEFRDQVRPLADGPAADLWERLFRGVKRPFHYRLAAGWLGDALRMDRGKARHVPVKRLGEECGWGEDAVVFVVHHTIQQDVVAGRWSWVRDCLRTGWLDSWTWNNVVICADKCRWAAVYWEGDGPRCISRGGRRLLSPT